jgi:hypothetical protein
VIELLVLIVGVALLLYVLHAFGVAVPSPRIR